MATSKKKRPKKNWRQMLIIVLMIVAIASMILPSIMPSPGSRAKRNANPPSQPQPQQESILEPPFTKEGELSFVSAETGEAIRKIDIEKAESDQERQQGLMYRRNMTDSQGMLFIMGKEGPQSFWMHNTYIPLDIIFVDASKTILNIHQNARPRSDTPLPSVGDALYVVEVIGGFTQAYGVKPGDKIDWQ